MSPSGKFLLAGVMGWPVMHSRSPKLHNYWLEKHGLAGVYVPLAIRPERIGAALRALPALAFSGCNLTIPHKETALALVDRIDERARRIGAISCVTVMADDSLLGSNYDAFGFLAALREAEPHWRGERGPVVVVGAGGAARAVLDGLIEEGAREIRLVNRTFERAERLAAAFAGPVRAYRWNERAALLDGAATLVNTTSLGMVGEPPLDLPLAALPRDCVVADIVYAPLETPLIAAARRRGNRTVDGLGMLLHQARPAFQAWFGILPEVTPELRARIAATL